MIMQLLKSQLALGLFIFLTMGDAQADDPVFSKDILPMLQQNCVSCHITGEELGSLGLAPPLAYGQLVDVQSEQNTLSRVKPGAPEDSYLIHKLKGTHLDQGGNGGRMPLGFPPLSEDQIGLITRWIASGAENN